jgi:DNA-binding NarL/FixJ family response regulator
VDCIEVLNAALDKANNVIPTLVVSGIIKPSGISALLELGVSRVLPKPIERTELIQAIQKTIV